MKTLLIHFLIIAFVFVSCEKDDNDQKKSANNIQIDNRTLEYNSCWLPIASGGYLMSIHIMFNDSESPTGISKLYFTTSFSQCNGGLPEVGKKYTIGGGSTCRIVSGGLFFLSESNPKGYSGEVWYAKGDFTFSKAEKDETNKRIYLSGTHNLTLTDTNGITHALEEQSFELVDSY